MKYRPRLAGGPVLVYVFRMLLLPAPGRSIDLSRTAFRQVKRGRWRLFLECVRHPILAFVVYQQVDRTALFSGRQKAALSVAGLHALIAAWLV